MAAKIESYIMPSWAETIRLVLADIVSDELNALKDRADDLVATAPETPEGIQAAQDLADGIFDIKDNIYIERGLLFAKDEMPALNIILNRADFQDSAGNILYDQVSNSMFNFIVHIAEPHEADAGAEVVITADRKALLKLTRIMYILRAILMNGYYKTLGLDNCGIERRFVNSIDPFKIDPRDGDAYQGVTGSMAITVRHHEYGPMASSVVVAGTENSGITIKVTIDDDGKVIRTKQ